MQNELKTLEEIVLDIRKLTPLKEKDAPEVLGKILEPLNDSFTETQKEAFRYITTIQNMHNTKLFNIVAELENKLRSNSNE